MKINLYYKKIIYIKTLIISIILIYKLEFNIIIENKILNINENYLSTQRESNLTFQNRIKNKIKVGIFTVGLKNGGRARITSQLIKYLNNNQLFEIFLFTQKIKEDNEYIKKETYKRILINSYKIDQLMNEITKKKINILIYQLSNITEINILNNIKNIKVIFYLHQSILYWIYHNYSIFKSLYKSYQSSKYIICLVPFENDYLFKEWGLSSILMDNFITFDYDYIISSQLSSKIILMIGRGADKYKRFRLGIQSMEYIIKDISESEMKIISDLNYIIVLKDLVNNLNLKYNIKFVGFTLSPEVYLKNASLHIFPTLSESFGLVLSEAKTYGIPNILLGLDYVTIAKKGSIIIYDDTPESVAKESIKILNNYKYRIKIGNEARISMKKLNNKNLINKWIKLLLSIYNGDIYYDNLRLINDQKLSQKFKFSLQIQIELLKMRTTSFENLTINNINNFTFLEQL